MIDLMIINYNMPEAVTEIIDSIHSRIPHRWIVVDNGSDIVPPHPKTNVFVKENHQVMSGALAGLQEITSEYFWDFSTSMGPIRCDGDPIAEMLSGFEGHPEIVAIFPALSGDIKSPTHTIYRQSDEHFSQVPIGAFDGMWRTDWLKSHLDHAFTSWGVDIDLGYKARREGLTMWVNNHVVTELVERKGYPERRHVSEEQNNRDESERMNRILSQNYGDNWWDIMEIREALSEH
jgi:hypothetical protein